MGQIVLIALAVAGALIASGLDPALARPSLAAVAALIALIGLSAPAARRALVSLHRLHGPAMAAFALLLAALVISSLGLSGDVASRARHAALQLFALMLMAGAVGAAAGAFGRTRMVSAVLLAAVAAAFVILAGAGFDAPTPFGRVPPAIGEPALAAAYGLVALLSIFAASDELRRRPAAGGRALPPLARRLFVPIAGLMCGFGMLLLCGSASALAAAAVGGVAFAAALALRARRSRVGMALVPAVVGISLIAATLAALATGAGGGLGWIGAGGVERDAFSPAMEALARWSERPLLGHGLDSLDATGAASAPTALRWVSETGYVGLGLALAGVGALGLGLALLNDRGRPVSRGFILFVGLAAFTITEALLSPAFDQPSSAFTLAIMIGVALSYLDFESTRRARSQPAA